MHTFSQSWPLQKLLYLFVLFFGLSYLHADEQFWEFNDNEQEVFWDEKEEDKSSSDNKDEKKITTSEKKESEEAKDNCKEDSKKNEEEGKEKKKDNQQNDNNNEKDNDKDKKGECDKKDEKDDAKKDDDKDKKDDDKKGDDKEEEKALKIGNLSLPTSQQPGPLVSFGENIVDKGTIQLFLFADEYRRRKGYFTDVIPGILYGITDNFSVFVNTPYAPRYKERRNRSAGFEDAFVQLEYAFYNGESLFWTDQATFVFNFTFPTGSSTKVPATGFDSPSFFIGGTYNHTAIDWFYFGSLGAILTTFHKNSKTADQYLYEAGFGRNIASPPGWIFAWMVEVDGLYASKNLVDGTVDHNSGGNVVYITPSIWISSEQIIFQLGAGGVLTQNLFGNQSRFTHQIVFNFGWTF